jgi:hypothetical protein
VLHLIANAHPIFMWRRASATDGQIGCVTGLICLDRAFEKGDVSLVASRAEIFRKRLGGAP